MTVRSLLSVIAAGALSAAAWADNWTSSKDVARSAYEFAGAAERLQKAIKDVNEDSPLVAEVRSLSKTADRLRDSVDKGATYEDAMKDFHKIESSFAHFDAGLKKAHDVHHEKPVADAAKKAKTTFDQLQAHMTGRRPTQKADQVRGYPGMFSCILRYLNGIAFFDVSGLNVLSIR